jgi:hypothetical protein
LQEGYLQSFSQGKVGLSSAALSGLTGSQRTTAAALSHVLPAGRALTVARTYPSLSPLIEALHDPGKSAKEREGLLAVACGSGGAGVGGGGAAAVVGKQSAKNVFEFFTQRDPQAPCKPAS